jgi:hypothetical protein
LTPTDCRSRAACASFAALPGPARAFPPTALDASFRQAAAEILFEPLPDRRLRANPRVVKRKMSSFGVKRAHHRDWPQPSREPNEAIELKAPKAA